MVRGLRLIGERPRLCVAGGLTANALGATAWHDFRRWLHDVLRPRAEPVQGPPKSSAYAGRRERIAGQNWPSDQR